MKELPSGSVTFLFTDIEGSTELLRTLGDGYAELVREYRRIVSEIAERFGGGVYGAFADEISVVFQTAAEAVRPQASPNARLRSPRCPKESRCVSEWASIPASPFLGAASIWGSMSTAPPESALPATAGRCSYRRRRMLHSEMHLPSASLSVITAYMNSKVCPNLSGSFRCSSSAYATTSRPSGSAIKARRPPSFLGAARSLPARCSRP